MNERGGYSHEATKPRSHEAKRAGGCHWQLVCQCMLFMLVGSGCQTLPHEQAKQQADQRWREVRARVKLQLGKQQFDGGLFADSIATLSEAVALDPRSAQAYELVAQAHLELGRPASAEQVIVNARAAGLMSADLYYSMGVVLEQRDRIDEAREEYAKARALEGGRLDPLVAEAECLVDLDRPADAMALLEENADRFDDNATVMTLAGQVALRLGQDEKAIKYLTRAHLSASDDPRMAESLALLLVEAGRCEQAIPMLRKVLEATPEVQSSRRALGRCLLAKDDATAAVTLLSDHVQANPTDVQSGVTLAQAFLELGDSSAARRTLERLDRPQDPSVLLTSAAICWKSGRWADAESQLRVLLQRDADNAAALHLLAAILRAQDQTTEADECLARAMAVTSVK